MYYLKELFESSEGPAEFARGYCDRLTEMLTALETGKLDEVLAAVEKAVAEDATIFVAGNGGSGAVASHFVNDLGPNTLIEGQPPIRVLSLTDNAESVTAVANDKGYDNIFSHQVWSMVRPGDVLIALSVSGNSTNILRAVERARSTGATTIGWTGFDGGKLAELCDHSVVVPSTGDEYGPVEDMFGIFAHIIANYLTLKRGRNLHH